MNNYQKFYLKLFVRYFLYMSISLYIMTTLITYYEFKTSGKITLEHFNYMIWFELFLDILIGSICSVVIICYYAQSFNKIQNNLVDDRWTIVERDNIRFELSNSQVYKKCISCVSSLNWNILEEKKITDGVADFNRIIGVTNFGISLLSDIFILDVSEFDIGITSVHCSIRPMAIHSRFGIRRCKKRLGKIIGCLSTKENKLHTPEPAPRR